MSKINDKLEALEGDSPEGAALHKRMLNVFVASCEARIRDCKAEIKRQEGLIEDIRNSQNNI